MAGEDRTPNRPAARAVGAILSSRAVPAGGRVGVEAAAEGADARGCGRGHRTILREARGRAGADARAGDGGVAARRGLALSDGSATPVSHDADVAPANLLREQAIVERLVSALLFRLQYNG